MCFFLCVVVVLLCTRLQRCLVGPTPSLRSCPFFCSLIVCVAEGAAQRLIAIFARGFLRWVSFFLFAQLIFPFRRKGFFPGSLLSILLRSPFVVFPISFSARSASPQELKCRLASFAGEKDSSGKFSVSYPPNAKLFPSLRKGMFLLLRG